MHLYIFDLIGCFAFAFYGARKGLAQGFGLAGVILCGFLTALGGGTLREMILSHPPIYFHDYTYLSIVAVGCIVALMTRQSQDRLRHVMTTADALGISTFAFIGAARADTAGLGVAAMIMFAVLTALGGGLLSDIVTRQTPLVCQRSLYVAPAALMGVLYAALGLQAHQPAVGYSLLAVIFLLQFLIVYRRPILGRVQRVARSGRIVLLLLQ